MCSPRTECSGMDFVGPRERPAVGIESQAPASGICRGSLGARGLRAGPPRGHPANEHPCCPAHLAVGCANTGHLLVELIQLGLELLQLLPLRAHTLVVLAGEGKLAPCSWLSAPGAAQYPPQVPSFTLESASP